MDVPSLDYTSQAAASPVLSGTTTPANGSDPMAKFVGGVFKCNPKARTRAASTEASPNREPHGCQKIQEAPTWKKLSDNGKKAARLQTDPYSWGDDEGADPPRTGEQLGGQAWSGPTASS